MIKKKIPDVTGVIPTVPTPFPTKAIIPTTLGEFSTALALVFFYNSSQFAHCRNAAAHPSTPSLEPQLGGGPLFTGATSSADLAGGSHSWWSRGSNFSSSAFRPLPFQFQWNLRPTFDVSVVGNRGFDLCHPNDAFQFHHAPFVYPRFCILIGLVG